MRKVTTVAVFITLIALPTAVYFLSISMILMNVILLPQMICLADSVLMGLVKKNSIILTKEYDMKKMVMVWLFALLGVCAYAQETISPEVFYAQPFVRNDVVLPKEEYNNFEELFAHLGSPIDEFRTSHPRPRNTGDYTRGFGYRYYSVVAYYSKALNKVLVFEIKLDTKRLVYNGGFSIEDTRDKIQAVFSAFIEKGKNGLDYYLRKDEILLRHNNFDIIFQFGGKNELKGIEMRNFKYNANIGEYRD
jgi:hypothetical protein